MLRSVSGQLRRHFRCALNSSLNARCLSSVPVNQRFNLGECLSQPDNSLFVSKYTRSVQNRSFFTTARICADLKKFPCPSLPESISDGGMKYLKKLGDNVTVDETVCEIETQKTALPVRSDVDGVLVEWHVEDGGTVTPGMALFSVAVGGGAGAVPLKTAPAAGAAAPPPPPPPPPAAPTPAPEPVAKAPEPTPVVEAPKVAPEAPKILTPITTQFPPPGPMYATAAPKAAPSPSPIVAHVTAPPPLPAEEAKAQGSSRTETRVRMTRMRQTIAGRMKDAQNTYAMLTTFNEVDMTNVFEMRKRYADAFMKKHGIKLGFMSPFIVGTAAALREMPICNAVIDGKDIVYRDYIDVGVAVATPRGLVVPVIRNADKMTLAEAERTLADYGDRARKDKITLEDMDGGTFTISNGGVFGSFFGTPIINPPQSAILGMYNITERAMVVRDPGVPASAPPRIEARPIMYLALTYDHRLIDGREAVTFLRRIKAIVEDPRLLLLGLSI